MLTPGNHPVKNYESQIDRSIIVASNVTHVINYFASFGEFSGVTNSPPATETSVTSVSWMTRPLILFLSAENQKYSGSWTSTCRKIDAFDYDETSGTLQNRRTIVKVDPSLGVSWFISSKMTVFWRWQKLLVTYFKLPFFILCASLWRLFCQSFSLNQLIQWHHRMSYLHSEGIKWPEQTVDLN